MFDIKGKLEGEIDVKRFYLEGLEIHVKCPNCAREFELNQYVQFPKMNMPFDLMIYCCECEHEWNKLVKLNVELVEVYDWKVDEDLS